MTPPNEAAHSEHLAQAQDHLRWRHDHLEALSILKRAEAAIFAYQSRIAAQKNILLMICDQCALRRNLAEGEFHQCGKGEVKPKGVVEGVQAGCFPQLYAALAPAQPDQVITL